MVMWRIVLLTLLVLLAIILTAWFDYIERNGRDSMTIEIVRGPYTWQYRQRPDEPNVLESRPIYRGSPWRFLKRFGTEAEARAALLKLAEQSDNLESGTK